MANVVGQLKSEQLVQASHFRQGLFDYSLWLDDFFAITPAKTGDGGRTITSLTGLGFV